jgi:Rps23 Pro-64 3,4-dihydroxylase Tpa1-like proline 4-hydroxylase
MEVKTDLHNYIIEFDNVMPKDIHKNFKKICENSNAFQDAAIIGNVKNKSHTEIEQIVNPLIRKTSAWSPENITAKSLTEAHWANFLLNTFKCFIEMYQEQITFYEKFQVKELSILKYSLGGHYRFHTDHHRKVPRIYSCIFLVNDDYEGGDLIFKYPNSEKITKINKKQNKMIIWPSNFLYPHSITPVTKGERYSVVAWAL